jgi:hypothetical protein
MWLFLGCLVKKAQGWIKSHSCDNTYGLYPIHISTTLTEVCVVCIETACCLKLTHPDSASLMMCGGKHAFKEASINMK